MNKSGWSGMNMQHQNMYFHNVMELETSPHLPGWRLQRFPKEVRHALEEKGRTKAVQSNGCELRFVTEAKHVRVMLSSQDTDGKVLVFKGDFLHSSHQLQAGVIHTIPLEAPERFPDVTSERLNNSAFSSKVWRFFFERFCGVFHGIDTFGFDVRPPHQHEIPRLTMMAYGSSITQGAGALSNYNCYIQQTGRRLGIDVLNLGLSGSCYCEHELADHIAERNDWDVGFLEIGVNMRGVYTVGEFKKRAVYLLDRIIERHPEKPLFLTTMYPNRATYSREGSALSAYKDNELQFNEVLIQYAADKKHAQLQLLHGEQIMSDFTSLTSDLIHPSDYGHIRMGEKLSGLIEPGIERLRAELVKSTK
jgi:lysophospholipase L1-like esterase